MTTKKEMLAVTRTDREKGAIVYLDLFRKMQDTSLIEYGIFSWKWTNWFKADASGHSQIVRKVYKETVMYAGKTEEEIQNYRNTFLLYPERVIPDDLKEMAESTIVRVELAKNTNRYLSGFRVVREENNHEVLKFGDYSGTYEEIKKYLRSLPTKESVLQSEKYALDILKDDNATLGRKLRVVSSYSQKICTKKFALVIERLIKKTNSMQILNAAMLLAQRLDIRNSTNNKPLIRKVNKNAYVKLERIPPFNKKKQVEKMIDNCISDAGISRDYTSWERAQWKLLKKALFKLYPKEADILHDRKPDAKAFKKWLEAYCKDLTIKNQTENR